MTIRYRFPAAILLATLVAGLLTTATVIWRTPTAVPAHGEMSPEERRRVAEPHRDDQAARDDA